MIKLNLSYIAGFFDGEGSISIAKEKKKPTHNSTLRLRVSVSNNNIEILNRIQKTVKLGRVYQRKPKTSDLVFDSRTATEFLRLIAPYLYVRRPQAVLALKFARRLENSSHRPISKREWLVRKNIREKIIKLNGGNNKTKELSPYIKTKAGRPKKSAR